MHHIYEEMAGPPKILRVKTAPRWQPDWRGLPRALAKQSLNLLLLSVAVFGFFKFSQRYLMQTVQVDGASMAPTLANADWHLLNHLTYRFRDPKPSDIVVLQDPVTNGLAVKRIVARPGDCVYVQGGHLFVNGELLPEPYLPPGTPTYAGPEYRAQLWVCGQNQYFVLGDNRNNSADSRIYGTVPRQNILGTILY